MNTGGRTRPLPTSVGRTLIVVAVSSHKISLFVWSCSLVSGNLWHGKVRQLDRLQGLGESAHKSRIGSPTVTLAFLASHATTLLATHIRLLTLVKDAALYRLGTSSHETALHGSD